MMLTLLSGSALWLAVGLFGFFMGSFGTLSPLLVQDSFGIRSFGTIMGLISATTVISFGLGPLIAGLSYDLSGGYGPAFIGRGCDVRPGGGVAYPGRSIAAAGVPAFFDRGSRGGS